MKGAGTSRAVVTSDMQDSGVEDFVLWEADLADFLGLFVSLSFYFYFFLHTVSLCTAHWRARLAGCMITEKGCSSLASALTSNPSHLKELDLTYNHPGESGEKLLYARLENVQFALNNARYEQLVHMFVSGYMSAQERQRRSQATIQWRTSSSTTLPSNGVETQRREKSHHHYLPNYGWRTPKGGRVATTSNIGYQVGDTEEREVLNHLPYYMGGRHR
ncbi:hypothetical protein NFI96_029632 [Prochilodus magdalenae]|nr:hypothetical protein NFI96_029632 [Prochilodus magdalenae]